MNRRRDNRHNNISRTISISYQGLARVDGSARFSFGETSSVASVSGPIEVRLAAEQASQATFEVITRPLSNVAATESKAISSAVRAALIPSLILNKHPRTLVQLVVQALSSPRTRWKQPLISCMINSSSLALLNAASVPMRGVVCAVAVGHLPDVGFVVDPSEDECAYIDAGGCFAFMFAEGVGSGIENVWSSWRSQSGTFAEKDFTDARALAQAGAQRVYSAMKNSVSGMGTAEPFELLSSNDTKFEGHRGLGIGADDDNEMVI
ncbi:hypothetical protein AGABI1DRAFT_114059 [Agaricus bisporus var. burnettii JB137-S8]|uniref:Exoribonuclease phosphorolytic domain-containing protein n=1 Tax=Agaricus bisporus var. burnettii (strain JB137-S8 / ATCC MYA-4627 / FGSC 10392) TaxID=597362 RepID=K5VYF0_AGABU|nr:uncharacterized protein AGABI1DRAFT_114059 [Agaricus bisporus var. burnettii JB137-S8]EKM79519.1 hypothetical protein AGABI1DRAFT_114059 [Agaricus bisporus var. burnettii JB137-S8]